MKWFKFLIVLAAFIITIFLLDRLFAPIPTWADNMFRQYAQKKDSISMIVIGNSHTGALRCQKIGNCSVMNFSKAGIEMKERLTVLQEVVKKHGSLKFVVMSMDYDQIGHNPSDSYIGNMLRPYQLENETGPLCFIKKLNANNFLRHNRDFTILVDYYVRGINFRTDTSFIPLSFKNKNDLQACKKRALELSTLHFSASRMNDNFQILSEIIELLQANGIRLILINTPKSACFTETYNSNFDTVYAVKLKNFIAAKRLVYLDYGQAAGFDEDDFFDFDHVSMKGSAKLCDSIAKKIAL